MYSLCLLVVLFKIIRSKNFLVELAGENTTNAESLNDVLEKIIQEEMEGGNARNELS